MALRSRYFPIDAYTGLIKLDAGASAVTASGFIGTQWDQGAGVTSDINLVVSVSAITTSGSETYEFMIVGSNATDRSDGTVLASLTLGSAVTPETVTTAVSTTDTDANVFVLETRTSKSDIYYRYIDLYIAVAGTSPSITCTAFITKDMD